MATTTTRRTPPQGTPTNLFEQINFSFFSITTHSYYYLSQRQSTSSSFSASWHAVLAFIVPVFLTFLQIKYQGKDISPFDTYPKSMGVSIVSLLLYCPACYAVLKSSSYEDHRRCQTYARHGTVVFGSLGKFLPRQLLMLWNWLHQIVLGRVQAIPPSRLTTPSWLATPSWLTTLSRLASPSRLSTAHAFSNSRGNNLRRNILSV
ncbi:hypothetical protein ACSBR1_041411 [Camellia fascicularis]